MIADWVEANANERPDDHYLERARGTQQVSFADLARRKLAWSSALEAAHLPRGARVALRLSDPVEYACGYICLLALGQVVVPLDPRAPAREEERIRSATEPVATISGPGEGTLVLDREPAPLLPDGPRDADRERWHSPNLLPAWPGARACGAGVLLTSSGTTGPPKGIFLDEDQLAYVAEGIASHHRLGPDDRCLCPLPLFHVNAPVVALLASLVVGACVVLDDRFHRSRFWELVADAGITWINAVPAIIAVLAQSPEPDHPHNVVRFVRSASAPLPVSVLERFEAQEGLPILETYGMTEAASMITANPLAGPRKPGSVGQPVGVELRVQGADGRAAGQGEVGRVELRGRGVITAYTFGARNGAISCDGWLDSGDLGYLDNDGFLYLVGRADDLINRGGENIYPREIEEVLACHPLVREAVVVGRADPILGAYPVAYVTAVAEIDRGLDLGEELLAWCGARLSGYKVPQELSIVDSLPRGPTGKVLRRQLVSELTSLRT
jgi:acyl-CoA synthetase (AMP-forming)/AMP-acid ligase II